MKMWMQFKVMPRGYEGCPDWIVVVLKNKFRVIGAHHRFALGLVKFGFRLDSLLNPVEDFRVWGVLTGVVLWMFWPGTGLSYTLTSILTTWELTGDGFPSGEGGVYPIGHINLWLVWIKARQRYSLPSCLYRKTASFLNTAARLVFGSRKYKDLSLLLHDGGKMLITFCNELTNRNLTLDIKVYCIREQLVFTPLVDRSL